MEEKAREDEKDVEVMAVEAVEVSGGRGEFLQKVRQRARPLSSTRPTATGAGGGPGVRERTKRTGVVSERWRGG